MRKNTFDIPQEEMNRFHKAMDAERTEQDAHLEKLIESEKANIPSNEAIIKMIPSKAVREYLQKIGHQFSERDRYLLWLYLDPKKEDKSEELWEKAAMFQFRIRSGGAIFQFAMTLVLRLQIQGNTKANMKSA